MTYLCQFCKKEYQSDGLRKPKSFKKDGSDYQYYDSTLFCSKECCIKKSHEKRKQTLENTPEIMKNVAEKRKQTLRDNPEIEIRRNERHRQTLRDNPEIKMKQVERRRQTYKNNPDIMKRSRENQKQTFKNNPDIMKRSIERRRQTYKNNPDIEMKQVEKRKQTFKNNPDIMKRSIERRRQTYKNNPDIMKRSHEKQKQTYKNHPEIIKESIKKTILTKRKNNTFNTSKSEDELYTLLKQKYPDIKRNYNSDRRYPYMCDFYIPSKDLFIELQASWTHGSAPFKNTDDQQFILNEWKQKSLKSNFYKNAIEVWTTRDVKKRQVAKSNKLNYIEVWTCDFKELYENNIL